MSSSLPPPPPLHFPGRSPGPTPRRSSWAVFTTACIGVAVLALYLVGESTGPEVPVPSGWCTPPEVRTPAPVVPLAPPPGPGPVAPHERA